MMSKKGGHGGGQGKKMDVAKQAFEMKTNCSQSIRLIDNFDIKHSELISELTADGAGVEEYQGQLLRLKERRRFLEKRLKENQEWAANYDKEFGPFVEKYAEFVKMMETLYGDAKEKHAKGLELLMEHFGYHPAFKRWFDSFSAVPFRPM
jgi:hypothetical protein